MKYPPVRQRPWRLLFVAASAVIVLGGCASYQPKPLQDQSPLATQLGGLQVEAKALHGGAKIHHKIDPTDGLDLTEIGVLAVFNNPDLKVRRTQLQVVGAQVFSAGLLPDPQIGAGLDNPTSVGPGLVNGWSIGLGYDIIPLITRRARVDAAGKGRDKVRLDLLWQEWQVIQRARSLAVRLRLEAQRLGLLRNMRTLYQERYQRSTQALKEGDITLVVNGTDLTALVGMLSQINQLERAHNETRHHLNLLLGLDPQVTVTIAPLSPKMPLSPEIVRAQLAKLPDVRPDLLALKAGYESQEARVRAAILAQFPSLGIGINRAQDTSDVYISSLSVTLTLPLLSGNRSNIAIERASREQLQTEYQARLAKASVDVDRLLELQDILREQQDNLQTYLPRLKTLVDRSRRAYRKGDIEALTFLNLESTWVNKRLEQISLVQATWENRLALEALLAMPELSEDPLSALSEIGEKL